MEKPLSNSTPYTISSGGSTAAVPCALCLTRHTKVTGGPHNSPKHSPHPLAELAYYAIQYVLDRVVGRPSPLGVGTDRRAPVECREVGCKLQALGSRDPPGAGPHDHVRAGAAARVHPHIGPGGNAHRKALVLGAVAAHEDVEAGRAGEAAVAAIPAAAVGRGLGGVGAAAARPGRREVEDFEGKGGEGGLEGLQPLLVAGALLQCGYGFGEGLRVAGILRGRRVDA